MKNFTFYCLVLSLSFVQILFAIDPPYDCYQPQNCSANRFPYKFCNSLTGEIINICVLDPYNITEEELDPQNYPPEEYDFVPMKLNLPICLDFDPNTDMPLIPGGEVIVPICGGSTCSHGVAFRTSDVVGDLRKAFNYWNCMCGVQSQHCKCSIKVKFSDNIDNFKNRYSDPTGSSIMNIYDKSGCQFECKDLVIYINNTRDYVRADNGSTTGFSRVKGIFYVTSSTLTSLRDEFQATGRTPYAANLTKIVANELGQMLGLGLLPEIGNFSCGWPEGASAMPKNIWREWDNIQANPGFVHCAFKKLYCAGGTDVKYSENQQLEVTSDDDFLTIKSMEQIKRITITDYLGRIIYNNNFTEYSNGMIQIDTKGLSNNIILFLKIETGNGIIYKKIIK